MLRKGNCTNYICSTEDQVKKPLKKSSSATLSRLESISISRMCRVKTCTERSAVVVCTFQTEALVSTSRIMVNTRLDGKQAEPSNVVIRMV